MENDNRVSILAVDDQPENLLALEAIFTDPELRLINARSGQEALKHILNEEFAVILMDAHMPEMDGFETAKIIRTRKKTHNTPIIFLTATHKDGFHAATGYDIGAVDYIFKPLIPEILKAKVSVFVELFKKTKEIRRQAEELGAYRLELEKSVAQLQSLNQDLQEMSRAADTARDQAIEASRFKSAFLANMSHEIRTPMNGILGMVEILLRSGLTEKQREYASTAIEAGRSLIAVVNDILDFSKIEVGKLSLEFAEFDPVILIESIADLLSSQAKKRDLSIVTFVDPSLPQVLRGDAGRLRQIITNLAGNAIKFSERGEVSIYATVDSHEGQPLRVKFSVADRGIGLTVEEVSQLFQPFVQPTHASTFRYGGTGLGLSISKRLVELMGGDIGVVSAKNSGSTFWFSVPLERLSSSTERRARPANAEGLRVLLIGDQPVTNESIQSYLNSWGIRNATAHSTEEAMSLLRSGLESDPFTVALIEASLSASGAKRAASADEATQEPQGALTIEASLSASGAKRAASADEATQEPQGALTIEASLSASGAKRAASADEATQEPQGKDLRQNELFKEVKLILIAAFDDEGPLHSGFDAYLAKPLKQSQLARVLSNSSGQPLEIENSTLPPESTSFATGPRHRSELILVAEDHPVNQQVAILLLQDLGFEAHVAINGQQAIESLGRASYALIFMDCQMPDMDGFQATRKIRESEAQRGKHIPIVAMTAHAIESSRDECLAAGMDDYICKPIDPDQLKRIVYKFLPLPK